MLVTTGKKQQGERDGARREEGRLSSLLPHLTSSAHVHTVFSANRAGINTRVLKPSKQFSNSGKLSILDFSSLKFFIKIKEQSAQWALCSVH